MKKKNCFISPYTVIQYNKMHYSSFHKHFFNKKKPKSSLTILNGIYHKSESFNNKFIKTRPAIVLGQTKYTFLIAPTTTKVKDPEVLNRFRTKIKINGNDSFICWDEVNHISKNQVTSLWRDSNKKAISLKTSTKRWVKRECEQKLIEKILK